MRAEATPILTTMLPLAHIGHYLWVLYLLPVVFVAIGIVKTTISEQRRRKDD